MTQANCLSPAPGVGAAFVSAATACNASAAAVTPCCYADCNKLNGLSVQDIFDFLNVWFTSSPYARINGNGTTTPEVADIFDFLNIWFAGGC